MSREKDEQDAEESSNCDIMRDLSLMDIGESFWKKRTAKMATMNEICLLAVSKEILSRGVKSLLRCVGGGEMVCLIRWLRAHHGRSKLLAALVAHPQILPFFCFLFCDRPSPPGKLQWSFSASRTFVEEASFYA